MSDKSLKAFWNDQETKDNVHNYLIAFLETTAVKKVFAKEDIAGVGEAKEIIDKAFENLDYLFGKKVDKKEPVNQAR